MTSFLYNNLFDDARLQKWSRKCSELRSHSQYNVKLSIMTSLKQHESMLRREKCYWSPSYSRHRIVSANKTLCKLLKQASNGYYSIQIPESFFSFMYIGIASLSCRVVDLKLPTVKAKEALLTRLANLSCLRNWQWKIENSLHEVLSLLDLY